MGSVGDVREGLHLPQAHPPAQPSEQRPCLQALLAAVWVHHEPYCTILVQSLEWHAKSGFALDGHAVLAETTVSPSAPEASFIEKTLTLIAHGPAELREEMTPSTGLT